MLDALLVLGVLAVRSVGDHNTPNLQEVLHDGLDLIVNLVDLGVKPSAGDEPAEFLIHVGLSHTKCICKRKDY